MKHYIDDKNQIRAIEANQEFLVQETWKLLTQSELDQKLQSFVKKPTEQDVQQKRSTLLSQTDWYVIRFQETGIEIPNNIIAYRQALRDITLQEGYPENVTWPEA